MFQIMNSLKTDIGLHTDGIRAVILCAVRKFGFLLLYGHAMDFADYGYKSDLA